MDASTSGMRCKLCSGRMTVWRSLPRYDLLECVDCGFRSIPYLDRPVPVSEPSEAEIQRNIAYAVTHLEGNKDRIAFCHALLSKTSPKGRVLDIGCGAGAFLNGLPEGYSGLGVELSPVWREISRRNGVAVHGEPVENPVWRGRGPFQAITLWDVIEHVNDPVGLTARCRDLLSPGGVLLMDTPNRDGLLYRFGELTTWISGGRVPTSLSIQYSPTPYDHKQIFRVEDMRRMLRGLGFEVEITTKFELSMPASFYARAIIRPRWLADAAAMVAPAVMGALPVRNKMIVVARKAA